MTAFPEDEYVLRLGRVMYAVGYLEWTILGDLSFYPDLPTELGAHTLAGRSTTEIGRALLDPRNLDRVTDPALRRWLEYGGECLRAIGPRRNAVLHARPATDESSEPSRQRLNRWAPRFGESYWISDQLLDELVDDIDPMLRELDALSPARADPG